MPFQSSYSFNLFTKRFLILHQNEQLVPLLIINHSLENTKLSCLTTTKEYFFLLLELWQNLVRKKLLEMTIYHTLIKLILQNLIEDKLLALSSSFLWPFTHGFTLVNIKVFLPQTDGFWSNLHENKRKCTRNATVRSIKKYYCGQTNISYISQL